MKENSNSIIAFNSLILYIRLGLVTIISLLTTRFSLEALGITDFGLFSLLGSIISFISILNTIMVSTSNRFIAVALGRNDLSAANIQFNINLIIHFFIALVTISVAFPLGKWYIYNYLNFDGSRSIAHTVYITTIIGSFIAFIGIPYNGLLVAKEKFIVFCSVDVFTHLVRLVISYLLINNFENKLIIYSYSIAFMTAFPTIAYVIYCHINYKEITKFKLVSDINRFKEILAFAGWISFGAVATIGKNQGSQIIVNLFFTTIMNSALGLANTVNTLLTTFSNSITQPIAPQLTKNFVAGNRDRCTSLLIISTKYTFILTLIISVPFLCSPEWIFSLWLGKVPPYLISFTYLIIIDTLITSLNSGLSNIIFASGKIKTYQLNINILRLLSVLFAYLSLYLGFEVYSFLYVYIFFSVIIFFEGQRVLHKTIDFDNKILLKKSYLPSILIVICLLPTFYFKEYINASYYIIFIEFYLFILILLIAVSKQEKQIIVNIILKHIKK